MSYKEGKEAVSPYPSLPTLSPTKGHTLFLVNNSGWEGERQREAWLRIPRFAKYTLRMEAGAGSGEL